MRRARVVFCEKVSKNKYVVCYILFRKMLFYEILMSYIII